MSVSDLNNTPLEFMIGDRKLKIQKLSVLDLFESVEKIIKEEYKSDIGELAKVLAEKDRPEFLRNAIKEMPKGKRLEELVDERMSTRAGGIEMLYAIVNKCQVVTKDELSSMLSKSENSDQVSTIMAYATSVGKEDVKDTHGEPEPKK